MPAATTIGGAGDSVCVGGPGCDGGDGAGFCRLRREADGGGDSDLDVWVREWAAPGGGAGLLRDEPGWVVLQVRWKAERGTKTPVNALWVQWAWTCLLCLSGSYGQLLDYVIFAVLVFYILTITGSVCAAADASGCGAALQGVRVSGAAGAIYRDGALDLCCTIAIQTSVHVAGLDYRSAGHSCVPGLDADGRRTRESVKASFKKVENLIRWRICWQLNLFTSADEAENEGERD